MRPAAGLRPAAADDARRPSARSTQPTAGLGQARPSAAARQRERRAHHGRRQSARAGRSVGFERRARRRNPRNPWPRGNCDRPRRSGHRRPGRASRSASITSSPICVRGDLALARAFEPAHDAVDHALDALGLDRPLAQRERDRARELVAVERHALAVLLHHGELAQLHPLEGGEARAAGGQKRRRRIAALSSVGRESFTWVSSWPQNGQRIRSPLSSSFVALSVADRSGSGGRARGTLPRTGCLDLRVAVRAVLGDSRRAPRRSAGRSGGTRPRRSRASCRRACPGGRRR